MAKPGLNTSSKVALSVLAALALCVGGAAVGGSLLADKPKLTATTADASQAARLILPTATHTPTTAAAPVATTAKAKAPATTTAKAKAKATHPPTSRPRTTAPKPRPTTPKPKPAGAAIRTGVHPGAFCSPEGATGTTVKGRAMRCTFKSGDIRARWRAA